MVYGLCMGQWLLLTWAVYGSMTVTHSTHLCTSTYICTYRCIWVIDCYGLWVNDCYSSVWNLCVYVYVYVNIYDLEFGGIPKKAIPEILTWDLSHSVWNLHICMHANKCTFKHMYMYMYTFFWNLHIYMHANIWNWHISMHANKFTYKYACKHM